MGRLRHVLTILAPPQSEQRTNVRHVLQTLEEWDQVHQVAVCRVADPALYRDGVVWKFGQPAARKNMDDEREGTHLDETYNSTGCCPES